MRDFFDHFVEQVQRERAAEAQRRDEEAWQREMRMDEERSEKERERNSQSDWQDENTFFFVRQTFRQRHQHKNATSFLRDVMRERDSVRYLRLRILEHVGRDIYIPGTTTRQIFEWNTSIGLRNLITVLLESVHRYERKHLTWDQFHAWFPYDEQGRPVGNMIGDGQTTRRIFAEADEYEAEQRAVALARAFGRTSWNTRKAA